MSINQLNQTIQAIRDIIAKKRSADPDIAKDFSELFRSTNRRLHQVSVLLSQNERMQAHSLSEQAPALPDLIRAFGFEKSNEWADLCREQGLSHPGSFDSRQVMLLMESYGDGSKNTTSLTDEFRGKMLKGDRAGAVTTLRVAIRKNPKDSWAQAELEKILAVETQARMIQMQKMLHQGDIKSLNRAFEDYEALGFPVLEGELFNQIANECIKHRKGELENELQIAPGKLEGWKKSGDWGSALEYSDDIRGRARELDIKIGVKGNLISLIGWADSCRQEDIRKNDIRNAENELKRVLSDYEASIGYREKKTLNQIRNQLGTLDQYRRKGEELKHDWSEDLEARRHKIELHLKKEETMHLQKMRLGIGIIVITTISALSAGGWFAYRKAKAENETKTIVNAIEHAKSQKTITELKKLLEIYDQNNSSMGLAQNEHKARIQAEIERARVASTDVEKAIEEFRLRLENPKRNWRDESRQIKLIEREIEECAFEYRTHLSNLKSKLEKKWLVLADEKKQSDFSAFSATLSECEKEYAGIRPGDGTAVLRLKPLNDKLQFLIKECESLAAPVSPSKEFVESIRDLADKVSKKSKVANEIESIRGEVAQAASEHSEKKYYQAIEKLALQPEVPAEISRAVKTVAKLSESAGKIRAKIWLPFNDTLIYEPTDGKNLVYANATPKEKELSSDLLDRAYLDAIYIYHIPDETVGILKMSTVYSIGQIQDRYQDPRGRWFARSCRLYNTELKDFEIKKRLLLSTDKSMPFATEEPLSRIFRESGMREFLEAIRDGSVKAPKISAGRIMDHILNATNVADSGKVFLLQKLAEVCALRPQIYGVAYLPWYTSYLDKLKETNVKDAEWLQNNSPEKPLCDLSFVPKNTESQIEFFRTLVTTGMSTELLLAGFVPENGLFPEIGEVQGGYVIPFENGKIEIHDKKREGLLPYTPIYQLKRRPSDIIHKAQEKSGMSDSDLRKIISTNYPLLEKYIN
jgi:ribosome-binding protein aMBF1 (putative translation factor)